MLGSWFCDVPATQEATEVQEENTQDMGDSSAINRPQVTLGRTSVSQGPVQPSCPSWKQAARSDEAGTDDGKSESPLPLPPGDISWLQG